MTSSLTSPLRKVFSANCVGYGMRDGKLIFIADVPRGLDCGCLCAHCHKPLVAKKGSTRRHHFAHSEVTGCHGAPESVLHLLSKELLAEMDEFVIPPYEFFKERKTKTGIVVQYRAPVPVAKGGKVPIHKVRVERSESDFVPDIIIESGSKSLIVEVAVTHKVTRAKLRKIRRRDLPAIELRLDPSDSLLPRESLKRKLQRDLASKVWLFHPAQRKAERGFFSKLRFVLAYHRRQARQPQGHLARLRKSLRLALLTPSQQLLQEYDRTAEEFNEKFHRYPTMKECLERWPHLFER